MTGTEIVAKNNRNDKRNADRQNHEHADTDWYGRQKIHKKFGSHNGFLTQSMHLSGNTKSNRSL